MTSAGASHLRVMGHDQGSKPLIGAALRSVTFILMSAVHTFGVRSDVLSPIFRFFRRFCIQMSRRRRTYESYVVGTDVVGIDFFRRSYNGIHDIRRYGH